MNGLNPEASRGQPAGLLRRLGAILYDSLLLLALMFLVTLPFIAARDGDPVQPSDNLIYQLCLAALIFVFFVGYWTRTGRTLGMQSWGLQLELADGNTPGFGAASLRFFTAIVSWLPAGLGFLWQLWDKDQRTWHDRASGTYLRYYARKNQ